MGKGSHRLKIPRSLRACRFKSGPGDHFNNRIKFVGYSAERGDYYESVIYALINSPRSQVFYLDSSQVLHQISEDARFYWRNNF